jgi:putative PEP-CTERM system TPR-repeat lipoprotein
MRRLSNAAAAIAAACALLAGCGQESPQAQLASAKQYLAKSDTKSAYIELKNALQQKGDLAEARFLLGKIMFDGGELGPAAIELRKARDLGHSADAVAPMLAKALLRQGQGSAVISEFATAVLGAPDATADLQTTLAIAYALAERRADASAALAAAFRAVPGYVPALVLQARQLAGERNPAPAFDVLAKALAKAPADVDVLTLQGDLAWGLRHDSASATSAYRQALAARKDDLGAAAGLLGIDFATNDIGAAKTDLDHLRRVRPDHPLTRFYTARLAFQGGDIKKANEVTQQLLKSVPDDPQALQLAGAIALRSGAPLQAQQYLGKALQVAPDLAVARRLLVQVLLESGQPEAALAAAQPLLEGGTAPDAKGLTIAGLAYLQNGNLKRAQELFAQASRLDPADPGSRTALAAARLAASGYDTAALGELEAIAGADAGIGADLALIAGHLERKDAANALKAIDRLEAKQPNQPLPPDLRGRVLLAKGDASGARHAFERALAADPAYLPAVQSLAALDLQNGQPERAAQRFEDVLKRQPAQAQALLALARLRATTGAPREQVVGLIDKAVQAQPSAAAPRVGLIDYYLELRDFKRALDAAGAAASALPDNPDILDSLARAQLAAGSTNQAISSYGRLANLRPRAPQPLVGLAAAQSAAKLNDTALQTAKQALAVAPAYAPAQKMLITLYQNAERHADALALARAVQKSQPAQAAGYLYEGDVEAFQRHWPAAAAAYRAALAKDGGAGAAPRLHMVLTADTKRAEAGTLATTWAAQHPDDADFIFYLGNLALAERDYKAARERFARVVALQPTNAEAHNNLAWAMGRLKDAGALAHAERANQLRPAQPAFLDTWAGLLADANRLDDAIRLEREALALEPDARARRLSLAKFYVKAGDKAAARDELQALLRQADGAPEYKEAEGLLKAL